MKPTPDLPARVIPSCDFLPLDLHGESFEATEISVHCINTDDLTQVPRQVTNSAIVTSHMQLIQMGPSRDSDPGNRNVKPQCIRLWGI